MVCFQVPLNPSCPITICPIMECSSNQCACPATLTSNAGSDQSFCETSSTSLTGNVVPQGKGTWTQVSGPNTATIATPTTSNTNVTGLVAGAYTFRWTIVCGNKSKSDDVIVTVKPKPVASASFSTPPILLVNPLPKIIFLGDNLTFCDGTTTSIPLKSNVNGTTFSWTAVQTDVAGAFADSNKVAIEQLLKLTSNKSGTVVYTVTAHSPALCASGSNRDFLVKVTPLDDASFSYSSAKYCQEEMDPAAIITGAL
ncbi:MAG TPA: hypothetical protein PK289_10895, partial [Bacteroidia bacterium]|nr:hypothetical protein [Bacteroidia bacterium]